jgi:hypothetical protein
MEKKVNKISGCYLKPICLIIGLSIIFSVFIGCGSAKKEKGAQTKYALIDSLLGSECSVPTTGKSLRLPIQFVPLTDSQLVPMKEYVRQQLGDVLDMSLRQYFHEDTSKSKVMIYSARDLNLTEDTTAFINKYRLAILTAFGEPNVKLDNYYVGDILVKEFIVGDSANSCMRTQLLCISKNNNAVVLEYITSMPLYEKFQKGIESSIASLKVVQ